VNKNREPRSIRKQLRSPRNAHIYTHHRMEYRSTEHCGLWYGGFYVVCLGSRADEREPYARQPIYVYVKSSGAWLEREGYHPADTNRNQAKKDAHPGTATVPMDIDVLRELLGWEPAKTSDWQTHLKNYLTYGTPQSPPLQYAGTTTGRMTWTQAIHDEITEVKYEDK
jgi:hypothetical protein